MRNLTLSEIWIYPIKSLGGIRLSKAKVLEKGLEFDRRWMLVDENFSFMTQRVHHQMALLKQSLTGNLLTINKTVADGTVVSSLTMNLTVPAKGQRILSKVWDNDVDVIEVDEVLSQWFSEQLNMKCHLVYFPEAHPRPVDEQYRVNEEHVGLADAYPFLIIGQASLSDLNQRLDNPVLMNRFRPNFVFDGGAPYEEEQWREFAIGDNRFVGVKPCARCVLTTVNQDTAIKGVEPLATLSTYRRKDNKVLFGQNVVARDHKTVSVGDRITLY
jgi:uncharacterized protein